jgi:hypothetical protein
MTIWSGTVDVVNGDKHVVVNVGPTLTNANCSNGSTIIIDRVAYFVDARDSVNGGTEFDLISDYEGVTATAVAAEISPVSATTQSLIEAAKNIVLLAAQLDVYDKNTAGLLFNRAAATTGDPSAGCFAFNTDGDPDTVTHIVVSDTDGNGLDVGAAFGIWTIGTILTVRSLNSKGYALYRVIATPTDNSGWKSFPIQIAQTNAHDGDLAVGEPYNINYSRIGEGLKIDATGTLSERSTYNSADTGFVFVATDTDPPNFYVKASPSSGDWGDAIPFQGQQGQRGWNPDLRWTNVAGKTALRFQAWIGGQGTTPTAFVGQYSDGVGGWTSDTSLAMNFKGITGDAGASAYAIAVANGFVGSQSAWLASLIGATGASAYDVAVANGFGGSQSAWLSSLIGADGVSPGVWFVWSASNSDANAGAGKVWASDDLSSASYLYFSKTNRTGQDYEQWLLYMDSSDSDIKGQINLANGDGSSQATVEILSAGVDDRTGYVRVAINYLGGADSFTVDELVSAEITRTGDKGTDGGGAGDVVGPAGGVVSNEFALFDGTTGKLIKGSGQLYGTLMVKASNLSDVADKQTSLDNLSTQGSNIVSASPLPLDSATGRLPIITGNTGFSAVTLTSGRSRRVRFTGTPVITVGANLVLNNNGSNYTVVAGDEIEFIARGSVIYGTIFKDTGKAVVPPTATEVSAVLGDIAVRWVPPTTTVAAYLDVREATDNGANRGRITVPTALAADRNYLFPDADMTFSTFMAGLMNTGNASAFRTAIGTIIGTDVQQYSALLTALAGLTGANGSFIRFTGATSAVMQAIIGTVSQSSSIPTGALFERGNNGNGYYERTAGGWQECISNGAHVTGINPTNTSGSVFTDGTHAWTYPAAFSISPGPRGWAQRTSGAGSGWLGGGTNANNGSTTAFSYFFVASQSNWTGCSYLSASGRWF